ncbi:MAG: hypothetical protein ACOX83_12225 [Candidatus Spyradocola sp.]|jgi:hypothetical protein
MSRAKRPVKHRHDLTPWTQEQSPAIETRPVTIRRMTPADYQRHGELVLEARRKAGMQIKKPLY